MPTVTSENLNDFIQSKLAGESPEGHADEENNEQYNKAASQAKQVTEGAKDKFSHREAQKHHRVAMDLAQTPENRAYHRAKALEHEEMADKMEREERSPGKKNAAKIKAARGRAIYDKTVRESN